MVSLFLGLALLATACNASPGMWGKPNGDINIGLVLPIHKPNQNLKVPYDPDDACGDLDDTQMLQATFFVNMIEAINKRDEFLPNINLGYSIVDSCSLPNVAMQRVSGWGEFKMERDMNGVANISDEKCPVSFVVGGYNSRVSLPLTMYLELFDIPLVDTGATLGDLSDRRRYIMFARTSPSDLHQTKAIADVAKLLEQQCVHIVYSEGLYGEMGADDLRARLAERKICIASDQKAPTLITSQSSNTFSDLVHNIRQNSTATTIICFCEDSTLSALLVAIKRERNMAGKMSDSGEVPRFMLMAGDYWTSQFSIVDVEDVAEGAVTVSIGLPPNITTGVVFNADNIVDAINSSYANPWLIEFFENKFQCSFTDEWAFPCNLDEMILADEDFPVNPEAELLYAGIMAGVQGLHTLLVQACPDGVFNKPECIDFVNKNGRKLYSNIVKQTVDMSEFGHPPFQFDDAGEGMPRYTFSNLQKSVFESDEGWITETYEYAPMVVWTTTNGETPQTTTFFDVVANAKLWPGTNETITSTCTCPAS